MVLARREGEASYSTPFLPGLLLAAPYTMAAPPALQDRFEKDGCQKLGRKWRHNTSPGCCSDVLHAWTEVPRRGRKDGRGTHSRLQGQSNTKTVIKRRCSASASSTQDAPRIKCCTSDNRRALAAATRCPPSQNETLQSTHRCAIESSQVHVSRGCASVWPVLLLPRHRISTAGARQKPRREGKRVRMSMSQIVIRTTGCGPGPWPPTRRL